MIDNFWKKLLGWICGVLFIIVAAVFVVGIETGEGFFGVIENVATKMELDPFADIKEKAYQSGYNIGRKEGIKAGKESGFDEGFEEGYAEGFEKGGQEKQTELIREGKSYDAGFRAGYEAGKKEIKENKTQSYNYNTFQNITINDTAEEEVSYVLNKNTKKFHYTWCSSVNDMKEKNKWRYSGMRDDVIDMGYVPCKRCNP